MMSYDLLQGKEYCMRYTRLGRGRLGVILVLVLLASLLSPINAFAAPAQSNKGNTEWVQVYTVQRGDTLSGIAQSFGVSQEALMKANSLNNPNQIYVGQQLIIPESYNTGTGGPQCESYYTVRRGDTLSEIALYHGINEYTLARANGIYDLNDIYVGQSLCIPSSGGGNYQPEKPQQQPEKPQNEGCNPCGQPQNEGPQRPSNEGQGCQGPCGGQNQGGQNNSGQQNQGPQRPDEGQGCSGPCGGPDNGGQQNQGPQRPEGQGCNNNPCGGPESGGQGGPQRPDEGHGCDNPCGGNKPEPQRPTEYWKGSYFNDKYFGEFVLERQDLEVNFNWGIYSPVGGVNADRFSVRWEKVEYFKGGPYRFYATSDDGVRVYVDDQLIIDGWAIQPATDFKADLNLSEGTHKIVVEYYEEAEDALIHVYWEPKRHNK
jgi:LysM repeat protein